MSTNPLNALNNLKSAFESVSNYTKQLPDYSSDSEWSLCSDISEAYENLCLGTCDVLSCKEKIFIH